MSIVCQRANSSFGYTILATAVARGVLVSQTLIGDQLPEVVRKELGAAIRLNRFDSWCSHMRLTLDKFEKLRCFRASFSFVF
jgi:hypothetical protein